jgi:3-hydroxyisobutyrate dehydrogenase
VGGLESAPSGPAAARLGVIGLGRMGLPICARLTRTGFAVTATDVRAGRCEAALAAGARWRPTAAAVAAESDVVLTVLPGPAEVSSLIAELTGALAPGSTWIDMSTAAPRVARAIATAARARGVRALDAPVGGSPDAARDGRLLSFVGADERDLEAQRPVLGTLADRIVHTGPPGSGYAVKLLANLLWFGQAVATAEALTLARRAGIDLELLLASLGRSAAASSFLAGDAASLLRGDDLASFPLARCCEQLACVLELGDELGIQLELAGVVAALHERALERYGDVDGELLGARYVAERSGVRLSEPPPSASVP